MKRVHFGQIAIFCLTGFQLLSRELPGARVGLSLPHCQLELLPHGSRDALRLI